MTDEIDRTSEKASSSEESPVKKEEVEETTKKVDENHKDVPSTSQGTSKKRKIDETSVEVGRPDNLGTVKRIKVDRKSEKTSVSEEGDEEKKEPAFDEPTATESLPMNIWSATDDFALITAVYHVSCLQYVHNVLPFSRKFSYKDLEERLCQLMYDGELSDAARKRMSAIDPRLKLKIQARTPFTRAEENFLLQSGDQMVSGITGMVLPKKAEKAEYEYHHTILKLDHFKTILEKNRSQFHPARTPQVLSDHYRRIKRYNERAEEQEDEYRSLEAPTDGTIDPVDYYAPLEACQERFHAISKKPALRGILSGFKTSSVPDNAIATIHGQFVQFSMVSKAAVIGRASSGEKVDIDLSKEGPAVKVSRQQAIIRQNPDSLFSIQNIGQRPIYVDGKPVPQMVSTSLIHGSIIEVATLRLVFSIPVPRVLHPLTRQIAIQHRKMEPLRPPPQPYQQYQKVAKKGRPPQPPKNASPSMHSVVRRAEPADKERLLKAVAQMGQH